MHALKGMACRKRVAAATATCKQGAALSRSRRLLDTLAAAPGLLAHASVTETVKIVRWVQKLRYTAVLRYCGSVGWAGRQHLSDLTSMQVREEDAFQAQTTLSKLL